MAYRYELPIAVRLSHDIEHRPGRELPYKARVRWVDPHTKHRRSLSRTHPSPGAAQEWIDALLAYVITPHTMALPPVLDPANPTW